MSFTHLQIRSGYSFMKSSVQVNELVKRAKDLNYKALALTDEEVLYSAIPFYKACVAHNITPIFGLTLTFTLSEEEVNSIVLAKSNKGYKELMNISTLLQTKNINSFHDLFNDTDELIMIILAKTTVVTSYLINQQQEALSNWLQQLYGKFSENNVYIGLERRTKLDDELILQTKEYCEQMGVKAVALHDVRYVNEEEAVGFDCLQAMHNNRKWSGTTIDNQSEGLHLRSKEEMKAAFNVWEEILTTSNEIATQCHVSFTFDDIHLPAFPLETTETTEDYLKRLCKASLNKKYLDKKQNEKAHKRLNDELSIITQLNFTDYFLIVADFVQFAKDKGIAVGPGRGSAAGSLVAYLLNITDVDPLAHNLLFERFLNPERVSMPDIDIDFSDNRRDEVIEYVREKYGTDYVAQIITFGTFAARSILREVMKVMNIDENDQTYILRHIPYDGSQTIAQSVRDTPELIKYIKQSKKLTTLFSVAIQLEGLPRHMSIHAAGIVIGKRPLFEDVPLTKGSHHTYVTQYAMHELESIGLLKMDLLGLKNLSLIERIVDSIRKYEDEAFTIDQIDKHDTKTFQLLQQGQTNGVFQFESSGMKQMLRQVKPTSLDDLIALNALYRPGPMEYIDTYTKRKHGKERVSYVHEDLKPILEETYGVLVYQEQIMQVAHRFASFTLGEADLLRRAISSKSHAEMEAQRQRFINGCLQNGYTMNVAQELFRWIVTFANYGFNKSHSVAYSKIAYSLAYLKANYPTYFFAQLLSSTISGNQDKRISYIREANECSLSILPPSINKSFAYFTVEQRSIRMGLMAIKGIGYETVKTIIDERERNAFTDLFDFVLRVKVRRNILETLILCGAFDETYHNRASLLASITPALERAELFGDYEVGALFKESTEMKAAYVDIEDFSLMEKLAEERILLGTYISTHPLKEKRHLLHKHSYESIYSIKRMKQGKLCKVITYVQRIKKIRTKRGDSMAFATLSDEFGEIEAVIFSNVWRLVNPWLEEDGLYRMEGRVSERNGKQQLIINRIDPFTLDELKEPKQKHLYIRIRQMDERKTLTFLNEIAQAHPGDTVVIVYDEETKESFKLSEKYALFCNKYCFRKLTDYFGTKNVVLR